MQTATRIGAASILVGGLVLALKTAAWWVTGSAALYSDALESVVNVAASAIALYALHVANRPADHDHPFGHAKAEFLAAAVEGALIVVAAASILQSAWHNFHAPHPLDAPLLGIALNLTATGVNFAWARVLVRAARTARSPALAADARHLLSDVATSVGIALGVALVLVTHRLWLDPVVAALTAIYVLWSGMRLLWMSAGGLMDQALDEPALAEIRGVIHEFGDGALEAHDLRTRQAGSRTFLEFHLVVPGSMSVARAHEICDCIEAAFRTRMAHMVVNIHVEPEHKAKHDDVVHI